MPGNFASFQNELPWLEACIVKLLGLLEYLTCHLSHGLLHSAVNYETARQKTAFLSCRKMLAVATWYRKINGRGEEMAEVTLARQLASSEPRCRRRATKRLRRWISARMESGRGELDELVHRSVVDFLKLGKYSVFCHSF